MRFKAVDSFRGMAAIMVILFHLQHLELLSGIAFIAKSDIFVDFFFVLSGFVITHSNYDRITNVASVWPFIRKRFNRLYPLHLFTLLLVLGFEIVRYGLDRYVVKLSFPVFASDKNLPSFIANLTLTQSLNLFDQVTWNGPSWSISVEFYTYIVWALCLVLFRKNLLLMGGFLFSLIGWFIVRHDGNIIFNYDYGFVRCLYSFLIGMFTYRMNRQLSLRFSYRQFSFVEVSLFILTIVAVNLFTHRESWLMPFLFAVVIVVFSRESGALAKLLASQRLAFLGKLSYSYYLNHTLVLTVMDLLFFKLMKVPHSAMSELLFVLICLACVHVMSVFTHRHVELILQPPAPDRSGKAMPKMVVS
ncbi:acyltransferase [Spirosoma humi]